MNVNQQGWHQVKTLRIIPRLGVVLPIYLVMYSVCYLAAYLLRFDFGPSESELATFQISLPILLLVKCGMGVLTREWRRRHRYTTLTDVLYVGVGATVSAIILYGLNSIGFIWPRVPRSVILIDGVLAILATCLLRGGIRLSAEAVSARLAKRKKERAIVFGASNAGIGIMRTIQATNLEYQVVGFVDDSVKANNAMVAGVPVYAAHWGLDWAARKLRAKHILIPSTVSGKRVRQLLDGCRQAGLKAHVIPAVHEIVNGRFKLEVRDVTISDLLRREPAQLDMAGIRECVTGRCVLVTGAAGSIGSELCRQILALQPKSLVLIDQSESGIFAMEQEFASDSDSQIDLHYLIADVGDKQSMARAMNVHRPQLMFHAAAYKHVPLMESNPQEAIRNNVLGTKNVVDLADKFGVERFVLISTDKAVRPSNIMGATKLVAEKYLQAIADNSSTSFITVRFGNVLNSVGSVVPTFRRQILAGGPISVTHPDMVRYFMTIPEAVQLVLQAGAIGSSGDVLILDMGKPVKIVDLAKDMIGLSGLKCPDDIEIVFTGIRPGEKLYEELFYGSEEDAKQVHDKIFCASRNGVRIHDVHRHIDRLETALQAGNQKSAAVLHEIVAHYVTEDSLLDSALKPAA